MSEKNAVVVSRPKLTIMRRVAVPSSSMRATLVPEVVSVSAVVPAAVSAVVPAAVSAVVPAAVSAVVPAAVSAVVPAAVSAVVPAAVSAVVPAAVSAVVPAAVRLQQICLTWMELRHPHVFAINIASDVKYRRLDGPLGDQKHKRKKWATEK